MSDIRKSAPKKHYLYRITAAAAGDTVRLRCVRCPSKQIDPTTYAVLVPVSEASPLGIHSSVRAADLNILAEDSHSTARCPFIVTWVKSPLMVRGKATEAMHLLIQLLYKSNAIKEESRDAARAAQEAFSAFQIPQDYQFTLESSYRKGVSFGGIFTPEVP